MPSDINTILVVEDDLPLREAVVMKLKKAGFRVIPASTAEDGILLLSSVEPNFIWLDMLLPGMSGLQFLEYIRKSEAHKDIPVMIVTASTGPEKVKRAFELNIFDFITKIDHPIKDIVNQITEYFDSKKTV